VEYGICFSGCLLSQEVNGVIKRLELLYKYWGKASSSPNESSTDYHLLIYHCLDVAAVGYSLMKLDNSLLKKFMDITSLDTNSALSLTSFFLAIHDIGKFSERFQNLKPELFNTLRDDVSNKEYIMRHDSMGFLLWKEMWNEIWENNCFNLDQSNYDQYDWGCVFDPWVQAVTGHHGKPPTSDVHGVQVSATTLFSLENIEIARSFVNIVSGLFISPNFLIPLNESESYNDPIDVTISCFKESSWLLAGLTILSDWIGSNSDYFEFHSEPIPLDEYWHKHALPQSIRALNDFGILPSSISKETGIKALFPTFSPTSLQSHVSNCFISPEPQLFILEDTTGSGKTEAALTLAHRMMQMGLASGIYIGLPTMATSNAMYERMAEAYHKLFIFGSNASLVLSHGGRHLSDSFRHSIGFLNKNDTEIYSNLKNSQNEETISVQCNRWIADSKKKSLLADVGVGTIDQALMSILPFNHQSLRILGLSRNILVVDEVHAYDSYIHTLLCTLLKFHAALSGSAILLSATLSMKQRQKLIDSFCEGRGIENKTIERNEYPLITHQCKNGLSEVAINPWPASCREIKVEFFNNLNDVESKIIDISNAGFCTCWIRNTVDDAIQSYDSLISRLETDKVILFHARFAMGDRLEIEKRVLESFGKKSINETRKGMVLVATQVVEQSLDLDFDYMISDLAPVDLLIQRIGRLQRHQRETERGKPTFGIVSPEFEINPQVGWYSHFFEKAAYVYENHGQLWLTAKILTQKGTISIPEDIRDLIECVFGETAYNAIPAELKNIEDKAKGNEMAEISLAHLNHLNLEQGYTKSGTSWIDDTLAPTRLGEPTTNVRFAMWDGENLIPWSDAGRFSWDMSEVSVNKKNLSSPATYPQKLITTIDNAKKSMPDQGKWCVIIPLSLDDNGLWKGTAKNIRGETVTLIYSPIRGLIVKKENEE